MSKIKIPPELMTVIVDSAFGLIKDALKRRNTAKAGMTRDEVREALLRRFEESGEVESPDEMDEGGES